MGIKEIKKDFFLWVFAVAWLIGILSAAVFLADKIIIQKDFYFPLGPMPILSVTMAVTWMICAVCLAIMLISAAAIYIQAYQRKRNTTKLFFRE